MPVDTVIPRLQTINAAITGVTRAYDTLPGKLSKADLPAMLVIPGEATQEQLTALGMAEERVYTLLLYVAPLALDTFNAAYNDARVFPRLVQAAYAAANRLNDLDTVLDAYLISDSGVQPLLYGQIQYAGIEFRLRVREVYGLTVDA